MPDSYAGAWDKVVQCAFSGNQRIKTGRPRVLAISDPANNIPANMKKGTIILDVSNAAALANNTARVYIANSTTTLVKIAN